MKVRARKRSPGMIVKVDKQDFVVSVERESSDQMKVCKGPWHYRRGPGTLLPVSKFSGNFKTCDECRQKHTESRQAIEERRNGVVQQLAEDLQNGPTGTPELVASNQLHSAAMHKWRVYIVKATEVIVYAKDYLDAGIEAGEGEVLRVERLD